MELSKQFVQKYQEQGFIQFLDYLALDTVKKVGRLVDSALAEGHKFAQRTSSERQAYRKTLHQIINVWREYEVFKQLCFDKRMVNMVKQLMGCDAVRLFQDQILVKESGPKNPTPWHQDNPYWPMQQENAITVWIALDDVNQENGCMQFIPGSHKHGKITLYNEIEPDIKLDELDAKSVAIPMKAGSLHVHHSMTLHYAFANMTNSPRRAYAAVYMADGTLSNGKPYASTDSVQIKKGDLIAHEIFPLLN